MMLTPMDLTSVEIVTDVKEAHNLKAYQPYDDDNNDSNDNNNSEKS